MWACVLWSRRRRHDRMVVVDDFLKRADLHGCSAELVDFLPLLLVPLFLRLEPLLVLDELPVWRCAVQDLCEMCVDVHLAHVYWLSSVREYEWVGERCRLYKIMQCQRQPYANKHANMHMGSVHSNACVWMTWMRQVL